MRILAAAVACAALAACGSSSLPSEDPAWGNSTDDSGSKADDAEFDEDVARADAEQEVADEGYSGPCTSDCSGHDAEFAWAANGHEDGGVSRSPSFDEGQEAYEQAVEERLQEKRQEFENEGADSEYAM